MIDFRAEMRALGGNRTNTAGVVWYLQELSIIDQYRSTSVLRARQRQSFLRIASVISLSVECRNWILMWIYTTVAGQGSVLRKLSILIKQRTLLILIYDAAPPSD